MTYHEKYIKRLLRLAQHYAAGRLYAKYVSMSVPEGRTPEQPPFFETDEGINFAFFTYVDEIAFLFDTDWSFDENEIPFLIEKPNLSVEDSIVSFLGITPKEFIHCFVPNGQRRELFGGETLEYHASPMDIGHNIFELVGRHTLMN